MRKEKKKKKKRKNEKGRELIIKQIRKRKLIENANNFHYLKKIFQCINDIIKERNHKINERRKKQ